MRRTDKRSTTRFINYDKYGRREALETFLDAIYFRNVFDKEEEMQNLENDPLIAQFLIANDNSYGWAMDEAIRVFTEIPNSQALFFKITKTLT